MANPSESPNKKNPILQAIDGDGVLNTNMGAELEQWGFTTKGDDYYVVAILGAQSSGKSTLMNMLFGTDFSVMVAKTGRRQTTLGVWVGMATTESTIDADKVKSDTVLVLDVEGTDSRERGEDHGQFERKTSLLSLALSEILLINMWVTDVGRHDGANYGLLKVVFELNLQLFQTAARNKSLLMFCFRDHSQLDDDTPLEHLVGVIREDMDKIWSGISKSEEFANSKVTDFFDFEFVSLPPKPHAPEKFKTQVLELKNRFLDPTNPNRLLSKNYKKDVPADGFSKYVEEIWKVIQDNRDLNLPSQKEMLSMFRCDQIALASLETFLAESATFQATLDRHELIPNFGQTLSQLVQNTYESYDSQAKRYVPEVAQNKKREMTEKMTLSASRFLKQQLSLLVSSGIQSLNDAIKAEVGKHKGGQIKNFKQVIQNIQENVMNEFRGQVDACKVDRFEGFANWSTSEETNEMERTVTKTIETLRQSQLDLLMNNSTKSFERDMSAWLGPFLQNGGSASNSTSAPAPTSGDETSSSSSNVKTTPGLADTWNQIQSKFDELAQKLLSDLNAYIDDLGLSEKSTLEVKSRMGTLGFDIMKKVLTDISNNIGWLMDKRFSATFKMDKDGVPRRWKPGDDLRGEYRKGCIAAERLLDQISVIRLKHHERGHSWLEIQDGNVVPKADITAVPEDLAVMKLNDVSRVLEQFRDQARIAFMQASQAQDSAAHGSYTVMVAIVMFLIFGWNEAVWILSNPLLLVLLSLIGVLTFVAYHLGLFPIIIPVFNTAVSTASNAFFNYNQRPAIQRPAAEREYLLRDERQKEKTE